jgi:hypothetical protein
MDAEKPLTLSGTEVEEVLVEKEAVVQAHYEEYRQRNDFSL